jgi:hypothetical protein
MARHHPAFPDDAGHARQPRAPLPPRSDPLSADEPAHDADGMTHEQLVAALRSVGGLVDVGREHPNFQFRGKSFLHFHSADAGTYADVRFGSGDFEPMWAASPRERLELLARVLDHVERVKRPRKDRRRRLERGRDG